jgi:CBS domain-containing protein
MISCPYCDHENIEGVDVCDQCGQPLSDLHLSDPTTVVERSLLRDRVSILWPSPPIVVSPETKVSDVLQLLVDREIGCVFIVAEDQKVTGVFSERDALLRLNTQAGSYKNRPIADFMTPNPQSLAADAKVAFAVHCMDLGGYRHIPIVDAEGRVTGVISARDILRYLTEKMAR